LRYLKPVRANFLPRLTAILLGAVFLSACAGQIDRHGHVFMDVDLDQVQPGMTKEQVQTVLGSPDTTSTIGGDAYYYIASTQKTVAFFKPYEIDREVVAVYFNTGESVQQVAKYGLKDGIVVNYYHGETPARGKDVTIVEQLFGNLAQRQLFKDDRYKQGGGVPGPGL
jgi:outer membrane protein assembly factor BamE (lipoprotein component of BamABCDE complex)